MFVIIASFIFPGIWSKLFWHAYCKTFIYLSKLNSFSINCGPNWSGPLAMLMQKTSRTTRNIIDLKLLNFCSHFGRKSKSPHSVDVIDESRIEEPKCDLRTDLRRFLYNLCGFLKVDLIDFQSSLIDSMLSLC